MKKHLLTAFFAAIISAPWACGLNYLNLETMKVESGSLVPAPVRTVKNATVDGEEGVMVTYDIKYIQIDSNAVNKGTNRIGIPGFGEMTTVSGVKLPVRLDPLFVGNGTEFEVKLVESAYKNVLFMKPFSPGIGTMNPQTDDVSKIGAIADKNAEFFTTQRYRGNDICYVKVTPVSFSKFQNAKIATRMSYFVKRVQGVEKTAARDFSDMPYLEWDRLNNLVINEVTDRIQIADVTAKLKNQSYLVISHPDFREAVTSFVDWKKKLGFNMITELRSNWTEMTISEFIKKEYARTPDLCYILIIGNTSCIPPRVMQIDFLGEEMTYESDIVYGNVDGDEDWLSEFPVGRLYVSPQEAKSVVNKIISYEKCPTKNQKFYSNILAASEFESDLVEKENRLSILSMETIRNYMTKLSTENTNKYSLGGSTSIPYKQDRFYYASNNLDPKYDFYGDSLSEDLLRPHYNWNPAANSIVKAINEGRFLTLFNGNAKKTGWLHVPFNILHLSELTNKELPTIIFNVNDLGIKQLKNNIFINNLVNKPDGGAIAAINTISDFIPYGFDVMLLNMVDAIWPKPGIESKFYYPYGNRQSEVVLGNVMFHGIETIIECFGLYERDVRRYMGSIYHITGDPSIRIPTGIPVNIIGNVETKFESNQITVNTFPYHVVFSVTDKTLGTFNRFEGMHLTLPASAADDYEIWISGRNIIPSEVSVNAASKIISRPDITITSVTPNPAYEKAVVKFSGNVPAGCKVQLVNLMNGTTLKLDINGECESLDIDVSGIKAGNYAVSLVMDNQILDSKQLIIK